MVRHYGKTLYGMTLYGTPIDTLWDTHIFDTLPLGA